MSGLQDKDLFLRIDDRLIHGQVVEAWIPHLKPQAVVVVSDAAAQDDVQQSLMSIAVPASVELLVSKVADALAGIEAFRRQGRRVLVLVPGPLEALALLERGLPVRSVNVGGLHHSAGKIQVGKALFLNAADQKALKDIAARGVMLEGRAVPHEAPSDLSALLG